jgi:hypothetical protein
MAAFFAEPLVVAKNRSVALGAGAVGHQLILTHRETWHPMASISLQGTSYRSASKTLGRRTMLDVRIRHKAVAVSVWVVGLADVVGAALDLPLAEAV